MTTEEFNSVAENRHIPAIRLGKDGATGHEIVRYHMETLKAFLSVSAKTSFLDRNSYIYQRNAMPKFPDEDEFRRRQETTVRKNREKKEELRQKGQQEQKAQHGSQQQRVNSQNRQKPGGQQRNQQGGGQHRDQQRNSDQKIPPTWRKNPVDVMADAKKKQEEAEKKAVAEKAANSAEKKPEDVKAPQKEEKAPVTAEKAPAREAEAAKKPENSEADAPSRPATEAEQPPVVFSAHKPSSEDTQKNADFGNTVAKKKTSLVDDFAADLLKEMDGSSAGDDEEAAEPAAEKEVSQEEKKKEPSPDSPSGRMPSPDPKNDDSEDGLDNGFAFPMKSLGTGL